MTTLVGTTLLAKEILPYTVDVIYVGLFSLVYYLGTKNVGGAISGLTDEVVKEEEKIWNDAKVKAEESLKMNIEQIAGSGASDLVKVTEQLYDDAKQLVQLEQKAVSHKHQLEYYTKAKQILDEWVRYETKQKESEKSYISDQVIA
jgi:acyl-CoA thioesterase